jgi:hypothetical protein
LLNRQRNLSLRVRKSHASAPLRTGIAFVSRHIQKSSASPDTAASRRHFREALTNQPTT